jgi:hypothetical protein
VALESKMCVLQNWTNLEKRLPFPQFSSKLSDFFKKLKALESILFLSSSTNQKKSLGKSWKNFDEN